MTITISRRKLIGTTSAGLAAASLVGGPAVLAQDDDKPTIRAGSKNYTEQLIMGELMAQLAEAGGYPVERQENLGGTLVVHEGLMAGDIDTYVEYTGTALIAILALDLPEADAASDSDSEATPTIAGGGRADQVYDIVAKAYPEELGVEWLDPLGFNNTYAMAMRREHAEELGVTKVSDLEPLAGDLSVGSDAEGMVRDDGVAGLEDTYGFEFGGKVTLDVGLMYPAVRDGEVDVITAFATDGRIQAMDLVLLEDDMEFFPPYHAAPIVRQEVLEANPDLREVLNQMAGKIDDARMVEMNYLADGEGMEHADIVRNLLIEEGIVSED